MRDTNQLHVGDEAPDFCILATEKNGDEQQKTELCLHDFRGLKPVIIEFYQAAFTPT